MDGGPGYPVGVGKLAKTRAVLAIAHDGFAVEVQRPAADVPAFETGTPHAGPDTLDDQVTFKFGDCADDDYDAPAQRAAGIDLLAETGILNAQVVELV